MGNPRHRFKVPADQRCHCGSCAMDLQAHPQDSFSMRIGIPSETKTLEGRVALAPAAAADLVRRGHEVFIQRSEEHTSELQSLMRISYAVFCLKKKKNTIKTTRIKYSRHIKMT